MWQLDFNWNVGPTSRFRNDELKIKQKKDIFTNLRERLSNSLNNKLWQTND